MEFPRRQPDPGGDGGVAGLALHQLQLMPIGGGQLHGPFAANQGSLVAQLDDAAMEPLAPVGLCGSGQAIQIGNP